MADAAADIYTERARLVAHLASLYPSVLAYSDLHTPDWPVVTITTPAGQMTWHISPGDKHLFDHVEQVDPADPRAHWDGHDTTVKYERLAALARGAQLDPEQLRAFVRQHHGVLRQVLVFEARGGAEWLANFIRQRERIEGPDWLKSLGR
jgi:hypothetical protein